MTLAEKQWRLATIHEVVLEYLLAERHKHVQTEWIAQLLDNPDLQDTFQNHRRLHLIYATRRWIMGEIPPDTQWFEVQPITQRDLDQVHAIARCGWDHPADKNEICKVAKRRPIPWRHETLVRRPILFGHDKAGPLTILEGNHRLTAFAGSAANSSISLSIFVGLSSIPCAYHIFDSELALLSPFWRSDEEFLAHMNPAKHRA